jgi:hypothetical protein
MVKMKLEEQKKREKILEIATHIAAGCAAKGGVAYYHGEIANRNKSIIDTAEDLYRRIMEPEAAKEFDDNYYKSLNDLP